MPVQQLGYNISVHSDGVEIPVYQIEHINDHTVTCYIPSDAGKEFTVKFRNEQAAGYGASFYTFMDGREMQEFAVYPHQETTVAGVHETLDSIRPFEFARLKLKEDDEDEDETSVDLAKLGLIEILVCRAIITPDESGAGEYQPQGVQAELDAVSEKAKKVGWHSVALGQTKPLAIAVDIPHVTYIDTKEHPHAIFRFRYLPTGLLEDKGIIPVRDTSVSSASPAPSTGKRPRRDDLLERPRKRKASVKAELGSGMPVKCETDTVSPIGGREPSPIRVPEDLQGQVIDLTDD